MTKGKNLPEKTETGKPARQESLQEYLRRPALINEFQLALGKGFDVQRYLRGALTTIALDRGSLKSCTPESIFKAICTGAQLRLDLSVGKGHAYLIPFYNTKLGRYEAQFVPGWKGYIAKARESGSVAAVWIELVYKDDTFMVEKGTQPRITHVPNLGSSNFGKDAHITHFYSAVKFSNGEIDFEVMTREQVDAIRSEVDRKTKDGSSVWENYYGEMGRKTVFRRMAKRLQLPELETMNAIDSAIDEGRAANVAMSGEVEMEERAPAVVIESQPEQDVEDFEIKAWEIASGLGWSQDDFRQYITDFAGKPIDKLNPAERVKIMDALKNQVENNG